MRSFTVSDGDPDSQVFHYREVVTFEGMTQVGTGLPVTAEYVGSYQGGWIGAFWNNGTPAYVYYGDFAPTTRFVASTSDFTVCFLAGTLIGTPAGERRVETLATGDTVVTANGERRAVRWVGRQTITAVFADPLHAFPVRIAAGALADGLPQRDLLVSPDHALLVGGVLVQAGALVNGTTIRRMPAPAPVFTYYHVEVEDHALLLAEGVPAESFVDTVTRRRFDNYAEYTALGYGDEPVIHEQVLPRIKSWRQVPRHVRACLATRSARLGAGEVAA